MLLARVTPQKNWEKKKGEAKKERSVSAGSNYALQHQPATTPPREGPIFGST